MRYHKLKDIQSIWWKSHKKSNESYPVPKPILAKVLVPSTKHHKAKLYAIAAQYLSEGKKVKLSSNLELQDDAIIENSIFNKF